jgi:mannose-6-phosphate isomerase-like protein (cupin superfamily)
MPQQNDIKTDHRPWGYFTVLCTEEKFNVKKIVVYPGKRLSLQRHYKRSEHWYILDGEASITLNDRILKVKEGQSVDIQHQELHRIENTGAKDLLFIEIQRGDYFGEDDIERIDDDFGRL